MAWRTLGEGMLMIDLYEQWRASEQLDQSTFGPPDAPQVERAMQWWKKLGR